MHYFIHVLVFVSILGLHSMSYAGDIVYNKGRLASHCSKTVLSSGTTGAPGLGTIIWANEAIKCDSREVARISRWNSEFGGSDCTVSLRDSDNYTLSGNKCNTAVIEEKDIIPVVGGIIYQNSRLIAAGICSINTTSSGQTGAPGMGTITWKNQSIACLGFNIAKISSWDSEYGGSDCTIRLESSAAAGYTLSGNKCSSATLRSN